MNKTHIETDFCVVGGGLSGVCAAIAAARNGARVVLIQNRPVLGGNSSSEIRMHIVGANFKRPGARESGLIEEFRLDDAVRNPARGASPWDLLLYEKVISEPLITLLLNTECTGCETKMNDGVKRIVSVRALRNSTEEEFDIRAKWFADCSGDGRLGLEAGADFRMGREAQSEYGESLAQPVADNKTLGSTILFMARKHERPVPFIRPHWVRQFTKDDFKVGRGIGNSFEYGYWFLEWGGELDTIRDNDAIRHELLRIALGIWDYVKNSGDHPDSANWALDWVGAIPGKRESRRFLGPHVMTEQDVLSGRVFPDQVAFGGWPIDLHPPAGIDARDERPCFHQSFDSLYSIPLRSLCSRNVGNLFLAGRNLSATHVAFASTRVMATCSLMGQGIGVAAAIATRDLTDKPAAKVSDLSGGAFIRAIQQTLLKDDALLLGLRNEDPLDLARSASVTASDHDASFPPTEITDGVTRSLKATWGKWSDDGGHQWRSRTLPAWIELSWDSPVTIREVHLTFDSGFERILILTFSDSANENVIRGPQPETVRDYQIYADGKLLLEVKDNWSRKRVHRLDAEVNADTVRVLVSATNGAPEARIFEVRVY